MATIPIRDVPGEAVEPSGNELILIDNGIAMQKATINDAVTPKATEIADDKIAALNLGTASQSNVEDFATAAQGDLADSAVQPGDLAAVATSGDYNDLANLPTLGTASTKDIEYFATADRGLPSGGGTGEVLIKNSGSDYDAEWRAVAEATAVSYAPQTLTPAEQGQARANIGVGHTFNTVAALLADETMSYTPGEGLIEVGPGDIIEAQGFRYEVAESDAEDAHVETAGGVKLYVLAKNGSIYVEQFGTIEGADETAFVQQAIDAAGALGASLDLLRIYDLQTFTPGPCPDGIAGGYCLTCYAPVLVRGFGRRGGFRVPGDVHGVFVNADFVTFEEVAWKKGAGNAGTIGHYIKFVGNIQSPKVLRCSFENCSDAGVHFGWHFNDVNDHYTDPDFDIFDYGPKDIEAVGNYIEGVQGDGGIEISGVTGGVVSGNTIKGGATHGIRLVGMRNGAVFQNTIHDTGFGPSIVGAAIAAYSGGHTPPGSVSGPIILRNENTEIRENKVIDCYDGIWVGIGATGVNIVGNVGNVTNYQIRVGHIGALSDVGYAESLVARNRLSGGISSVYVQIPSSDQPPSGADAMRDVDVTDNDFIGYSGVGFIVVTAYADRVLRRSHFRRNRLYPADSSPDSPNADYQSTYNIDCDLTGNITTAQNGREIIVFDTDTGCKFPRPERIKVSRSLNTLVRDSGAKISLKTGQLVTVESTGTLPAGLSPNTPYYVIRNSATSFRLATSIEDAFSGIGVGMSDDGAGHHYIVPIDG